METIAGAVGEPIAGSVLRAAMAMTAFGPAPGDVDEYDTLMLLSQRPMMFQDSEVEMQDRVGAVETAVDDAVDHMASAGMCQDASQHSFLHVPSGVVARPAGARRPFDRAALTRCKGRVGEDACLSCRAHPWRWELVGRRGVALGDSAGGRGLRARKCQVHGGTFGWERQVSDEGSCALDSGGRGGGRTHPRYGVSGGFPGFRLNSEVLYPVEHHGHRVIGVSARADSPKKRLLVCAHLQGTGHGGVDATMARPERHCMWDRGKILPHFTVGDYVLVARVSRQGKHRRLMST